MALSEPPENFHQRDLSRHLHTYGSGDILYRIQSCEHECPFFFGASDDSRFDNPGEDLGLCYVSESKAGAFVETEGRKKLVGEPIAEEHLEKNCLLKVRLEAQLSVLDFQGEHLLALGVDANISSTPDYELPKAWAMAIATHPANLDGIRWRARHDNSKISVGVFERWHDPSKYDFENLGAIQPDNPRFLAEMIQRYDLVIPEEE